MSEELRREVDAFGHVRYYNKEGQRHRLDGPAVEMANGDKEWWIDGKLHRLDGPAVDWVDEYKAWCQNGKLHRLDGPAREWGDGSKEWWLNGKYYKTEKEWEDARCPSIEEAIKMFKEVQS